MLFPQKVIGLIGKKSSLTFYADKKIEVEVVGCPSNLKPLTSRLQAQGKIELLFETVGLLYQYQVIKLRLTDLETDKKVMVEVQARVFGEREFFVTLVISSNFHYGWNPEPTAQYFRKGDDELVLYKDENMGNDAFIHALKLEPIFHKYNTPITWLIDDIVANKAVKQLKQWHWQFGDDYGLLPRSYFYHNYRNYNTETSIEQTTEIISVLRDTICDLFTEENFPYYPRILGVDQWVGSVGTNFIKAAEKLELEGVWGIGYDHLACDTSMFHRGTPWEAYKPKENNFRVPGIDGKVWLFQWTTRDILNTSYFTPNGATIFSTDADDIRVNNIWKYQNDYYARILSEYKKNMTHNDFFMFLVHQEDHDSHIRTSNQILETFLDQIHADNIFVTLDEAVSWLNLKYLPDEHPYQIIEMNDPLSCHQELKREAEQGLLKKEFATHPQWGVRVNPTHIAYYGVDALWIGRKPENVPVILYDYAHSEKYPFNETGEFPMETLPQITSVRESWKKIKNGRQFKLIFYSDREFENLPWLIWYAPIKKKSGRFQSHSKEQGESLAYQTATMLIVIIKKVVVGKNEFIFTFSGSENK